MLWMNVLPASSGEKKKTEATNSSTALISNYQNEWHHITESYMINGI
jgi:hypothetical protein